MRTISMGEKMQLRELLQLETTGVAKAKAMQGLIKDDELKSFTIAGIQAGEARIKGIQQFLNENHLVSKEVH